MALPPAEMAGASDDEEPTLPPHLELQRTRVVCAADAPSYVSFFHLSLLFIFLFFFFVSVCMPEFMGLLELNVGLQRGRWFGRSNDDRQLAGRRRGVHMTPSS